jgi:hypothetical protein
MGMKTMNFTQRNKVWQEADLLLQQGHFEACIALFEKAYAQDDQHDWYPLFIGDIYRYYLKQTDKALHYYELPLIHAKDRMKTSTLSPLRYLLKRVSNHYYEKENWERAIHYYSWFISFKPSNFHDKEFVRYAKALVNSGEKNKAIEVLALGLKHSFSREIKKAWNELSSDPVEILPFPSVKAGYERISIKTDIIMPGMDIAKEIDSYTKHIRKEGDILTIASCVVAVSERRIFSVDSIQASSFSRLLSRYVHDDQFPFGGNAPLCNPLSMQAAINETGALRILFSAIFGGVLSKIFPGSGMFYRLAGEQAALIDDMPGAIPPFDYYVVLGPKNSRNTCYAIKERTGHEAAVVDANDLQVAWAVGVSDPLLKKPIENALSDNPAGNGDQRTPIIVLRPLSDTVQKKPG